MSLEIGQLIDGKYRIGRQIGEGGMGAVFEGENVRINRRVAIKVLHAAHTGNAEVMQRFEREAGAAGRIGNDHILEVLDLGGLPNGDHFIVMEFLDGEPLSGRIQNLGKLSPQQLAPLMRQALVGLGAAHRAGIVHRDLKPDNIFILKEKAGKSDFIKIIDFGISKFQPLSGDGMKMTRTGTVMGTPYYMSPEQASGSTEADARSDIYSLGVIMFEALTGRVPFDASTFNQLMFKIVLADVPSPSVFVPELDPAFSSLVSKAMARDVTVRFQSTDEFLHALDAWMSHGAAVSVPPPMEGTPASLLEGVRQSMPGVPGMATVPGVNQQAPGTGGNWATSQVDAIPVKKSSGGLVAAVIAGVLLLGGAAFAAKTFMAKGAPVPDAASAAAAAGVGAVAPSSAPNAAPVVVPAPEAPPTVAVETPPPPASAAAAPEASSAASEVPPVKALAGKVAAAPLRPAAKPAPAPAAKPAAAPKSGGTPDFGY